MAPINAIAQQGQVPFETTRSFFHPNVPLFSKKHKKKPEISTLIPGISNVPVS
jgi:hypothetical protein